MTKWSASLSHAYTVIRSTGIHMHADTHLDTYSITHIHIYVPAHTSWVRNNTHSIMNINGPHSDIFYEYMHLYKCSVGQKAPVRREIEAQEDKTMEIENHLESSSQLSCRSSHKCVALVVYFCFHLLSTSPQTSSIGFKFGACAVLQSCETTI